MAIGDIIAPKQLSPIQRKILRFLDAHDNTPAGAIIVTGKRTTDCYMGTMRTDGSAVPVVQTNSTTMYKLQAYCWIQRIAGSNMYRISRAGLAMLYPAKP